MRRGAKPAKAKVEAKRPVAGMPRKKEGPGDRQLEKRLAEALKCEAEAREQQAATAEILRVISSSPSEVQPVFDAIASSATRLCDATFCVVFRFDGEMITVAADDGRSPGTLDVIRAAYPSPPGRQSISAQVIRERRVISIADAQSSAEYSHNAERARAIGYRAILSVPMLRGNAAIGAINVARLEAIPFSDSQVELLKTFADQAVIAIENVRQFNETKEALERQTATADILKVISSSPTDVQPVFDAIAESAFRLLSGAVAGVLRREGDGYRLMAMHSGSQAVGLPPNPEYVPIDPAANFPSRVFLGKTMLHIPDWTAIELPVHERGVYESMGVRSSLMLPLLRESECVGVLFVARASVRAYSDKEIGLMQSFADQAVIAIENVRLFNETKEALEQQTATAEILRVISRSPTDVQPVLAAVVTAARRFCGALDAVIALREDDAVFIAAHDGPLSTLTGIKLPLEGHVMGRAIGDNRTCHVRNYDDLDPLAFSVSLRLAQQHGIRSAVAAPMLRDGVAIGTIFLRKTETGGFTPRQIELLETFADQAVIAIENVRLFTELQTRTAELTQSVEKLTALGEVGRAVSSTLDLETVLTTIVSRAVHLSGLDGGVVFEYDDSTEEFVHRAATETGGTLAEARRTTRVRRGEGVVGQTAITLEPAQMPDIAMPGAYGLRLRENLLESGIRAILAVPMARDDQLIGCLVVSRNRPGEFPPETIELLRTFATQSALAIQNARLYRELEQKSCELQAASQHKSEFLANMSHELRTPLNAIIGFSEVLTERMFGDLNEKQEEYLKDIYASGQHLLSLINDILDLSKIEAGRMELELTDFDLPAAIDNALTLVRERAGRRGVALHQAVDGRLGAIRADERKLKQVVLNLLSNAIKFTPEEGRIEVRATPVDGSVEVSVTDTGVGIAPEDQEAVFEEFRQVGTADKKVEGTGLGLALSRKFVELHGGRIWVTSQVGVGSTFAFTLPLTIGQRGQTG